ncbi:hypothetical protein [Streptomyces sp. V3I7]|uniref:hypothetical protein n=1 Tax=Streptomyces sp. V3I7 TaxID=3042278 RepID=UPI0027D858AC|nr:hypothetical protein [Streptomyces sp. V3I7]
MSTTVAAAPERSAAEVNEEIRALWIRSGGTLSVEQREEYQRLVLEWAAVTPAPLEGGLSAASLPPPASPGVHQPHVAE